MWWRNAKPKDTERSTRSLSRRSHQRLLTAAIIERCESRTLLSLPPLPIIPTGAGHLFVVTAAPYNAVGDGSTNDTTAIQKAITDCTNAGGGTVEIPAAAGAYESGVLTMAKNVNLQIDSGAELQALTSIASSSTYIICKNISNFEITGLGTGATQGHIDGGSGGNTTNNLNMITLSGVSTALIQNVQLTNSPHEHINSGTPTNNNVTINGVTINTPATTSNTDGIDPAGTNWLIENCTISDGDDDIAIKPQNQACANIVIQNCTILAGHGISVGGQTNDGLNGLYINNVTFNGTTNGLRLKAERAVGTTLGMGGVVQNVYYSNITMTNVQYPILIDSYYNQSNNLPTNPSTVTFQTYINNQTPLWQNITFANITATNSASNSVAGVIYGLPEAPVANVNFVNVKLTAHTGLEINFATNVRFDANTHITASSGNDVYGSTSGTPTFPRPYATTIEGAGYSDLDIGAPTVATGTSSSFYDPNTAQWTMQGDGAGFTGTSDQFNAAFGSVIGDSTIQAQLKSLTTPGGGAVSQAGVMYRASNSATDPFAALVQTSSNQIVFEYRATAGGSVTVSTPVSATIGSDYLRITRTGSSFAGFYSTDGINWNPVGSAVAISAIGSTAPAGLATTSNSNGNLATAVFANVSALPGPVVATAAAATPNPVTGTSTALTVLGSEAGSDTNFLYIWQAGAPGSSSVTYSSETVNASKNTTANFTKAGTYNFTALIIDPLGLSTTSTVPVTVAQTPASITVSPSSTTVSENSTQQFSATANGPDQFGNALTGQPTFNWSITGAANSIDNTGNATLSSTPGTYTITAADSPVQGTASIIVEGFAVLSGSTLDINLSNTGPVTLTSTGGTITASQNGVQISFTGITGITVTDTASGDVLNVSGSPAVPFNFVGADTSTLNLTGGTLLFAAVPGGTINLDTLSISNGATATITTATTQNPTTLNINTLSIDPTSTLDVANNEVLINYGSGIDPIASIVQLIVGGYASGAWNGTGIISTIAQSNPNYGLGYADAADANNPANLPTGQIKILYTLLGDANLDSAVNGSDFAILSTNFNKGVSGWDQGDFNYDGAANGSDFASLSTNFNKGSNIAAVAPAPPPSVANIASQISEVTSTPSIPASPYTSTAPQTVQSPVPHTQHKKQSAHHRSSH